MLIISSHHKIDTLNWNSILSKEKEKKKKKKIKKKSIEIVFDERVLDACDGVGAAYQLHTLFPMN